MGRRDNVPHHKKVIAHPQNNKKTIFIEGSDDDANGDLHGGFRELFEKQHKTPRIIMGGGLNETIRKYLAAKAKVSNPDDFYLLIDSDVPPADRQDRLNTLGLRYDQDYVFFMIQEMEAWFLSQENILNEYFKFDPKLPKIANPQGILKPSNGLKDEVKKRTRKNNKKRQEKTYHKITDGASLLKKLDANQLSADFSDFKNLIAVL